MSASTPKTILLGTGDGGDRPIYNAKATVANITPGHFLVPAAAGVALPAAVGAVAARLVAVEATWSTSENTVDIDRVYANGDTVNYILAQPGDEIYAIIAASQTVLLNSVLEVTTAGTLAVEATNVGHDVVAVALEAITTTGSTARARVRIL